jgi:hypothetical protein
MSDSDEDFFPAELVCRFGGNPLAADDADNSRGSHDIAVTVSQDFMAARTGGVVWLSAQMLSHFLCKRSHFPRGDDDAGGAADNNGDATKNSWTNRTVMEVGAGCGLVGIVARKLGAARLVMTDTVDVLEHLDENLRRNLGDADVDATTLCCELSWGDKVNEATLLQSLAAVALPASAVQTGVEATRLDHVYVSNCM